MRFLNVLLLITITLFLTACSTKNITIDDIKIEDVKIYPQNPSIYMDNFQNVPLDKNELSKNFIKKYFSPWDLESIKYSKQEASWGNIYSKRKIYLENYRLAPKEWFEKVIDNANFEKYNTSLLKAITTRNCDFRVFPTKSPLFYNPKKAGEGFPFDYNQNSRVKINTPVFVSHFSKDKAWAFVQSHYVLGWVRVDNLLFVDDTQISQFTNNPLFVITKEGYQIFDKNLSEELKVGTFFPKENGKYLLATNFGIKEVSLNEDSIEPFPLDFNKNDISKLLNQFISEPYGWGGLNNNRDCSSFTQDFFTPFGIYLNRNSKAQTTLNRYIDISKFSDKEKKEFILNNAIPFLTLIYLRGHIMLYIGKKNNEPLVMHNMWGVRTKKYPSMVGRNVVGKTVITTLEPGIELEMADKENTILKRVQGIVLLNEKR